MCARWRAILISVHTEGNAREMDNKRMENVEKQEIQTNGTARIHLRPHHGVCLLNFRGEGYSDEFSRNMTAMKERLTANPEEKICITKGADDLCAKCPNRRGNACSSEHPPLFDENVLRMTGFFYGQVLTWSEFSHATEPISLYRLEEACPGCEWLPLCRKIAGDRIS